MGIYVRPTILEEVQQANDKAFIQAINEVYFGRTAGINRCFNAFCDFRHKYLDSSFLRGVKNIDADHDKELRRFISEMERQFGFFSFSFIISNSLSENMCTVPILFYDKRKKGQIIHGKWRPSRSDIRDWVYFDKEGYHFTKEIEMSCIIIAYSQMLFNDKYTDEEMFAIVLHEVGHNFQTFLNGDMLALGSVNSFVQYIKMLITAHVDLMTGHIGEYIGDIFAIASSEQNYHKASSRLFNELTSDENRLNIYSYFNFIKGIVKIPVDILEAIIMVPAAPLLGLASGIIQFLANLTIAGTIGHVYNYLGEQMADNFPTYYGFGKANINAQVNQMPSPFGPLSQSVGNIPIIGHLYNFTLMPALLLISISNEHPTNVVRAKSMINSMKTDVNDPALSPKLRAELKKQIDESEQIMDQYLKTANDVSDPRSLKVFCDKCIYTSANGGFKYRTFRSLFNIDKGVQRMSSEIKQESSLIINTPIK